MNTAIEVKHVVAALDAQRKTGFCDEYGIMQAWLDDVVDRVRREHATARENESVAATCERTLRKIARSDLTKNKLKQLAASAIATVDALRRNN